MVSLLVLMVFAFSAVHPDIRKKGHPRPIPTLMVRLAPTKGVWSCMFNGSIGISSIFIAVGVIAGQALSIYYSHL
jgi:hypothetical protein